MTEGGLLPSAARKIGVAYLARGADKDWQMKLERFARSYLLYPAGAEHSFYVIFKGFSCITDLLSAQKVFSPILYSPVFLDDDGFDIGAYAKWARLITDERICLLNSSSEILAPDWLRKLNANLELVNVGLVGATASYESLKTKRSAFPRFPNPHIRSNAFMIERVDFCSITQNIKIGSKMDAYLFESGAGNLTRRVLDAGKRVLLVGRNGRGYSPRFWPSSETFRLGRQENLLIGDNHTHAFNAMTMDMKAEIAALTWGQHVCYTAEPIV